MEDEIELLAPGGDVDSVKAAVAAGADAVYCGLGRFNARNRAVNIGFDDLGGIIRLAHGKGCKVFLTLNIIIVENEIPAFIRLLNRLANTGIDGVIVQDIGVAYLVSRYFKNLSIHASTQLTTHNRGQIDFLKRLDVQRVNLSRELSLKEIRPLAETCHERGIAVELFVHGSQCIAFSGLCYMSSVFSGKSGNRGRCSQPCRDRYQTTSAGKKFPLNLKDGSAFCDLKQIADAGVDSVKIEGRIKKPDYVYAVVSCWRRHLRKFYDENTVGDDDRDLYKVFNRGFSNYYLSGVIHKDMFIDSPKDSSIKNLSRINRLLNSKGSSDEKIDLFSEKERIYAAVRTAKEGLSIEKLPLKIDISGEHGSPLRIAVRAPDSSFTLSSEADLKLQTGKKRKILDHSFFWEKLKAVNDAGYLIEELALKDLQKDLVIPFKEITSLGKKLQLLLGGGARAVSHVEMPGLKKKASPETRPAPAVLISSEGDVDLCGKGLCDLYFMLPACAEYYKTGKDLFLDNRRIRPWFPSVLIGRHYRAAVDFLHEVNPGEIITDNAGIAYEAYKMGIPWTAGPHMNIANSFALICLKERFNCAGAFISNEISREQIRSIVPPDDFRLHYSIYHPILLMTSRQCLFQQVTGCERDASDDGCLLNCKRSSSITSLNSRTIHIEKKPGNYNCLFNHYNYLNTDIINDFPGMFSCFLMDLRNIRTGTVEDPDRLKIIGSFEEYLKGDACAGDRLKRLLSPTVSHQYARGV